jgi:anti-sigma B factor antagonist
VDSLYRIRGEACESSVGVILADGYLDFDAAPALKAAFVTQIEQGRCRIILDLSCTAFIDSTAIGVLVGALRRVQDLNGSLAVVCANENVRHTFEIVGLEHVVPLHSSRAEALLALAEAA